MVTILCALVSIFEFRVRSRASLELELIALRHQVTILRRQRPGRPQLSSLDRLLWVWLYRIWPQVIDAMVLVKPATVVQWHRNGFRLYWRWRSRRPGRPKIGTEIRDLIRRMSKANPLWGAPRIHGELLKLGIKISQATVGRWMPWRPKVPSPTWRTFLRNHLPDIAAIDMFVVATATFRLLYALIVLSLDRRRVVHFEVTQNPTQVWLSRPNDRGLSLGRCTALSAAGPRQIVWSGVPSSSSSDGNHGGHHCPAITLAESHMSSVLSVRSAVNVWITLSSSTSVTCAAYCRAIFNIIMTPERISRSTRTAHGLVAYNFPLQAILLPSPRSAVCIIAMSVEPREIGEAARLSPPNCLQFIFEQGQRYRLFSVVSSDIPRLCRTRASVACSSSPHPFNRYPLLLCLRPTRSRRTHTAPESTALEPMEESQPAHVRRLLVFISSSRTPPCCHSQVKNWHIVVEPIPRLSSQH